MKITNESKHKDNNKGNSIGTITSSCGLTSIILTHSGISSLLTTLNLNEYVIESPLFVSPATKLAVYDPTGAIS